LRRRATLVRYYAGRVYRINVDRDGDALAEAAFTFTFSERTGGRQTGTLFYAIGPEARQAEPGGDVLISGTPVAFDDASAKGVMAGPIRLFIGVRSEPFFADADGSFHGFQWTGRDAFAGKNVLSIVMEVPRGAGGPRRAARHPSLRPQQAGRVPERARHDRRHLQPALRLDVGR
jgi:Domain of unknown function (DUF4331)